MSTSNELKIPGLGKFIPLSAFRAEWATLFAQPFYGSEPVYLPTEFVVVSPRDVCVPRIASAYRTNFYEWYGRFVTSDQLLRLEKEEGRSFRGTAYYQEIVMVQVYANHGADGHVDYAQAGVRFVRESDVNLAAATLQYGDLEDV